MHRFADNFREYIIRSPTDSEQVQLFSHAGLAHDIVHLSPTVVFHSERSLIEEYVYFGQVQLYSYTLCPDLIVA